MASADANHSRVDRRLLIAATLAAIAVAVVLRGPALDVGYFQDDAMQIAALENAYPAERSPLDLFRFADMARDGRTPLDRGALPWWSDPDLRIAMFRPLSSALIAFDHRVFATNARAAHLHSMLWFAACIAAFALALGSLLPAAIVAIAVLAFAVDEAHSIPVAWLANRSYLVAQSFGWLGVWAHVRARRRAGPGPRGVEALFFSLALAGGEYALAMLAYPIALEFAASARSLRARIGALLPAIGPGLVYLTLRGALGFGANGSGLYRDPLTAPRAFAGTALERLLTLATKLVFGGATRFGLDTSTPQAWIVAGIAASAILIAAAWWAGRQLPRTQSRALIALALGALISLVPTLGALADERLLGAAAGGAAAVVGAVVCVAASLAHRALRAKQILRAIPLGALALLAVWVHGFETVASSRATLAHFAAQAHAEWYWAQRSAIPDDPNARVFFLSGADFTTNANLLWVRHLGGHVAPRSLWRLSPYSVRHQVRRVADNAIEVQIGQGMSLPLSNSLYRAERNPLTPGDVIEVDGMRVTVLDARGGDPTRLRFEFAQSLDDPSYVFLHATPRGLERVALPPVGGRLRLAQPAVPAESRAIAR